MKGKHLFSFLLLLMVAVNSWGTQFKYTYKGSTLNYIVLGDTKSVSVCYKCTDNTGHNYYGDIADDGTVFIPRVVSNNGTEYTVTEIFSDGFSENPNILRVIYPYSLVYVGSEAFQGCTNLVKFDMYDSSSKNCLINGNIQLGTSVFERCGFQNANVDFSNTSKYTPNIFRNCNHLEEVVVYGSVPQSAFQGCGALKVVNVNSNLESIDKSAFYYCSGLTFNFKGGVTEIPDDLFNNAQFRIDAVTFPSEGLKKIGKRAFKGCPALNDIGQIVCDEIGEEAFYGTGTDILDVSAGIIGKDAFSQMSISNSVVFRRLTNQMQPCFHGTGRGIAVSLAKNANEYDSFGIDIVSPFEESEFEYVAINPQDKSLRIGIFRGCDYLEAVSFNNPAGLDSYDRITSDCPKLMSYDIAQGKPNGYLFEDGCVYSNSSLIFAPEGRKSRIKLPSTITHIGAGASYSSLIYDMTSVQEAVNFVRYADLMEVPTLILTKKLADKFEAKYKGTAFLESLKSKWILQGDMNGDGQINVSDVTSLVNVILNK